MIKRCLALLLCVLLLSGTASAEGVVLRTVSCFAGSDAAAPAYVEILKNFEEKTGNVVEDNSATSDESWKASVLNDFAAGNEPDVLFFFAANADSAPILSKVVPIEEINAAYPGLHLQMNEALREIDGQIYAIPARPFWEGLLVNTDLFEQYDLELPTTWEKFEEAVRVFSAAGIVPVSVSLSDIPHYLAEMAILVCGSREDHEARPQSLKDVPQSWFEGMALIRHLYEIGAFADNVNATTESAASQLFRDKKAAMQIDGNWFANSIPEASMNTTVVIPMPAYAEDADPMAYIGGTSMGFYLTRSAWEDEKKRDAAVALLAWLTRKESLSQLGGYQLSGRLLASEEVLLAQSGSVHRPFQDDMNTDARETWLLKCISSVADGTMTPEECWAAVMELRPFEE